jgi:hypothetical protein
MSDPVHVWHVSTSGPGFTLRPTTLTQAKKFVEAHAPIPRGWSARWEMVRPGLHYYRRSNSKGRDMRSYSICLYRPDLQKKT